MSPHLPSALRGDPDVPEDVTTHHVSPVNLPEGDLHVTLKQYSHQFLEYDQHQIILAIGTLC